jgi:hypothetical protein
MCKLTAKMIFDGMTMLLARPTFAASQAKVENCGWLVPKKDALVPQPDSSLKPSDPSPLSKPPPQAKAAYCDRDTMMSYVGDQRVLQLGLNRPGYLGGCLV